MSDTQNLFDTEAALAWVETNYPVVRAADPLNLDRLGDDIAADERDAERDALFNFIENAAAGLVLPDPQLASFAKAAEQHQGIRIGNVPYWYGGPITEGDLDR